MLAHVKTICFAVKCVPELVYVFLTQLSDSVFKPCHHQIAIYSLLTSGVEQFSAKTNTVRMHVHQMTQSTCARVLVNISVSVLQIPEPAALAPIQMRITNKRIWTIVDSELRVVCVFSGALHSS